MLSPEIREFDLLPEDSSNLQRNADVEKLEFNASDKEEKPAHHNHHDDVDGGYGWVIVFCAFLFLFSTWGVNSAFGIYFAEYLRNNTFEGATKMDYAYIGGISFGVGLFSGPLIHFIHGKIGTHATILIGNCIQFTAIMLASYATKLWHLYLTQGLLQSYGLAFISLPAIPLVSPWFHKKRVLASGLSVMGSGAGGVVFTMGMYKIMEVRSVHWALRAQAIISAALVIIGVLLVKTKKHASVFTPIDVPTLKCVGFWILCLYYVTCMFGYVIVLYSMANLASSLGYSQHQGAIVATMVQVGFCYGRPLIGYISDKLGPATVTAFCYYMGCIFTLGMLIPARNYATLIMLGLLEGTFIGAIFPTTAPITARLVGLHRLNVAFCMSWMFVGAASIFAEPIGLSITPKNHNVVDPGLYQNTAIFAGCAFFVCATAALLMRGYIIARDVEMAKNHLDPSETDPLSVSVRPGEVFAHLFAWPAKRA
ncbi:putative transporter protein [Clavispora lusitaniae]|uniref:Transporter protein n=1 Tax=Clavispora lusitaniae TaxID=36911 RepID=A0ACD0WSZ2_CLALS|nr:Major Facilitator Superfamily protein [Clavispora lusitaniae]QFZ30597.1 putative transporter protein [Clavispora lusitaniae]QFZ36259.1 putative transporter protein [Clavispora lusitaniae]QFZ41943.1 putative transporter protein [Clavispora lusitaniae]QFZ47619.1 putative transporter protein [Clavispora lusitaniae]